jgi:hypothetical protein
VSWLRRPATLASLGCLLVLAVGPAAAASSSGAVTGAASKAKTIRRVTARLANTRFTRFVGSFDQRLHLCRDKSFIYDTVSSSEGSDPDVRRIEGTWRVTSASIRGRVWKARVRGTPSDGSPEITVSIRTDGSRTTIDGNVVIAERSDLC